MQITKVETFDIRVPLDRVRADSVNQTDSWGFATVRLHTDSGLVGTGYTGVARGAGSELILDAIHGHYASILLGADPSNRTGLWQRMYWSPLHWVGRAGVSHMALAAVDIALWDLAAQRAEKPLCDLLGGNDSPTFPAYNTDGGWLSFSVDELIANAKESVEQGFTAIKIKLGRPDGSEDLERISAVRVAVGSDVELMADVNQAWNLAQARRYGVRLDQFDVKWLEEPLGPDDWRSHARLAEAIATPIALGEHVYTATAFNDFITAGAVAYVQPDCTRLGGVTEFLRVAELADVHSLPVCPHAGDMMQVHQHLVFGVRRAHVFEHIPWGRQLFVNAAQVVDGALMRPAAPGAGTQMHDAEVERYLVSPVRASE